MIHYPIFDNFQANSRLTLTKVEYTLVTSNVLKLYFQSIFEVYLKYTSSILQPIELNKKKKKKEKGYTFEAHFVKLNHRFIVDLKYTSSILYIL